MKRLTKIVCTIWPSSRSEQNLSKLLDAWMNIVRLNCSHWALEEKWEIIKTVRKLCKQKWITAGFLLDNKWPEIRTLNTYNWKDILFEQGKKVILTIRNVNIDENTISVDYKWIINDLNIWNKVLIDDWLVELEVIEKKNDTDLICEVKNTWLVWSHKWVNLPWVAVNLPSLVDKDIKDLKFWCEMWVDYYALSFTRTAQDVLTAKKYLKQFWWENIKVICKIENQQWIDNFDEILEVADWIMVARWDLWIEIPIEEIPFAQKMMIQKCIQNEKVVITATQMLDSMIHNPRPTRAEATDVANAILDWTDAVMLSWETAKWKYPIESVQTMAKICLRAEKELIDYESFIEIENTTTDTIAKSIVDIAYFLEAKWIVVASQTWKIVKKIRKHFPNQPIIVITNNQKTYWQMNLVRWAFPILIEDFQDLQRFENLSIKLSKQMWIAKVWDKIVISWWKSVWNSWMTDWLKIIEIK